MYRINLRSCRIAFRDIDSFDCMAVTGEDKEQVVINFELLSLKDGDERDGDDTKDKEDEGLLVYNDRNKW